jgi:cation:H+ antiporter
MTTAFLDIVLGLSLLVWSADRFVEGSATTARHRCAHDEFNGSAQV